MKTYYSYQDGYTYYLAEDKYNGKIVLHGAPTFIDGTPDTMNGIPVNDFETKLPAEYRARIEKELE